VVYDKVVKREECQKVEKGCHFVRGGLAQGNRFIAILLGDLSGMGLNAHYVTVLVRSPPLFGKS